MLYLNGVHWKIRCQYGLASIFDEQKKLASANVANQRQFVRHEIVTHALGTICYLSLKNGPDLNGAPRGKSLNSLFETLEGRNTYLNKENINLSDASQNERERNRRSPVERGSSP